MDIDRGLLAALLREGIAEVYDENIVLEMLEGAGKAGFQFIETYFRTYRKVPSAEILFQEVGVVTTDMPKEPVKFWCKQIKDRFSYNALRAGLSEAVGKLENRDVDGTIVDLEKIVFEQYSKKPTAARTVSIFANSDELIADYERSKLGITGIPAPWTSMNLLTQGWQPEDLVVIAARPGSGKTWLLICLALWPWQQDNRKILFASTEMSRMSLKKRIAALQLKLSYGRIRRGTLTSVEEDNFKQRLKDLENDNRFLIMGDGFSVTLENIEASIIMNKPDLVCIDGFYLLRSVRAGGKNKFDRVSDMLDLTKDMTKRTKVPIILTTQMNRDPAKHQKGGKTADISLDRLAFSDNMGMIADYVFFIKQTKEMRESKKLELIPGKIREAEITKNISINWNFELQDFTERAEDVVKAEKKDAQRMKDANGFKDDSDDDEPSLDGPISDVPF